MDKKTVYQLGLTLLIGIACLLYFGREVKLTLLQEGLKQANIGWLFLALLVVVITWLLEAQALTALASGKPSRLTFRTSFYTTMIGQLFNQITPLASGGQPAQLYVLAKRGMNGGRATSILLIKFLVFQIMLVVSFTVILALGYPSLAKVLPNMKYLILVGYGVHTSIIGFLILILLNKRLASTFAQMLLKPVAMINKKKAAQWKKKLHKGLANYHEQSKVLIDHKGPLLTAALLTCAQLILFFTIPYFIFQAFHVNVSLFISAVYHAFIMMFASIVPTPGGSGAAEFTFNRLFQSFMSAELVVLCLLFWRLITAYMAVLVGILMTGVTGRKVAWERKRKKPH